MDRVKRIWYLPPMRAAKVQASKKEEKKTLSRLSVHVVNRLLCENRKSIPIFFNGKNF